MIRELSDLTILTFWRNNMIPESIFTISRADIAKLKKSRMSGYGVTKNEIIFGDSGLESLEQNGSIQDIPAEGRFCGIFIQKNHAIIKTDATGQEILYVFQSGDDWSVSNSFITLLNHVSKSHKLNLNPTSIHGFHLKNGRHIGEQLISHRTVVQEIRVLPITSHLNVDLKTGELTEVCQKYLEMFPVINDSEYPILMRDFLSRGIGIIQAFRDLGLGTKLLLSGGYDSRLVLCMLLETESRSPIRIQSFTHKKDDFRVAKSLSKMFNLPLNVSGPPSKSTISSSEAMDIHEMTSFGSYLPFYYPKSNGRTQNFEMVLTGDQPTGWSHFAGNYLFNGNPSKIKNDIQQYLSERKIGKDVALEFWSTFNELGIDPLDPAAMMMHYSAIRSRFHCGRHWAKSFGNQYLVTPLTQSSIVRLDMFNASKGFHPTKFFVDAYSVFEDWAVSHPFETPERNLQQDLIMSSPMKNQSTIIPTKFQIHGNLEQKPYVNEKYELPAENLTDAAMKNEIEMRFNEINVSSLKQFFTSQDFTQAKSEIQSSGRLSQDYRKVMHMISIDKIIKIISNN